MAVVGSPEGGTLVFRVRWQWPVLSHDVFILDQSSTYVFYYAPWGCVLIGLGGTRLFCLECPFPSLSVCGLSCCPIMGMGVVLKFCNLQYGCSTVCLAVFSGFVFRIVVISHFCRFYRGLRSLPDVSSRCLPMVCWRVFFAMEMGFFNL